MTGVATAAFVMDHSRPDWLECALAGLAALPMPKAKAFIDSQRRRIAGLHDMPARMALRLSNAPAIRGMLGGRYEAACATFRKTLAPLEAVDAKVVESLERTGVFVTSLDALALPDSRAIIASATILADRFAEEARRRVAAGIDFNVVPADAIVAEPTIYRWGLQDRLLDIAEAYLGLPVGYDGVSINYTVADGREASTRKWHRDWEDRRMLKVAVYLNDVDERGGPFQMIARADDRPNDNDGFRYELASDAEMAERLGPRFHDSVVSCEGPAGTVIFTDTAGFYHRGKPAVEQDRKAIFYSYFARSPRHPFLCERSGLSRRDIALLAGGLPPRQRAVALWRDDIPALLKLIPTARI